MNRSRRNKFALRITGYDSSLDFVPARVFREALAAVAKDIEEGHPELSDIKVEEVRDVRRPFQRVCKKDGSVTIEG